MILEMAAALLLSVPEQSPKPAQRARANLSEYFSTDDYPETAARRGIQGTVSFRLTISPEGRVTKCTVTRSSNDAALDAATCSILLSRAEYLPARDAEGHAIEGSDMGRVTWRLPVSTDVPQDPLERVRAPVRIEMTFGKDELERPVCTARFNGVSGGADSAAICASTMASVGGAIDLFPRNVAVSFDVAINLEGQSPVPATVTERGSLMVDSVADLTVNADGRVTACTVRQTNFHHDLTGGPSLPPLCEFPGFQGTMFPAAPENAAPRHGVIRVELYLRTGPARRST